MPPDTVPDDWAVVSPTPASVRATRPLPAAPAQSSDYEVRKRDVHNRLVEHLNLDRLNEIPEEIQRSELKQLLVEMVSREPFVPHDRERMVGELLDEVFGFGPLEILLREDSVSDILVNGPFEVYVERRGKLELTPVRFRDPDHVRQVLDRIVSRVGRRVDESSPLVDARLPDGSRVNAIVAPIALRGPSISIRRFGKKPLRLEDLLRFQMLTQEMASFLNGCILARLNIVISGGTGSGKTTLLNTLSAFIPDHERIVTIEDAAELQLQQRHVVPLETRPSNIEGKGAISTRDLVKNALRMRPDRIVVGECRGAETLDMLQAMNTGHDGSLTTLHANSPRDALSRMETMMMMAGFEMPLKAMRQQIGSALDLIIQANRFQGGGRRVTSITEVVGLEGDVVVLQDLFRYEPLGVNDLGKTVGRFEATGVRPQAAGRIQAAGYELPTSLFAERVLAEA